jgi:hypothetical protein
MIDSDHSIAAPAEKARTERAQRDPPTVFGDQRRLPNPDLHAWLEGA